MKVNTSSTMVINKVPVLNAKYIRYLNDYPQWHTIRDFFPLYGGTSNGKTRDKNIKKALHNLEKAGFVMSVHAYKYREALNEQNYVGKIYIRVNSPLFISNTVLWHDNKIAVTKYATKQH